MMKMKKLAAFAAKNAGRYRVAMACALACLAGSVFAEGEPLGVLETFDVETVGAAIREIMLTLITVIGGIYATSFGFVILRFLYRKVTGTVNQSK